VTGVGKLEPKPSGDGGSLDDMPTLTIPAAESSAPHWEALKDLVQAGHYEVRQIFRLYPAGDELAELGPGQAGPVRCETVLYLDDDDQPRTAVHLPSGKWKTRSGWSVESR
jgi:hypothetical protein